MLNGMIYNNVMENSSIKKLAAVMNRVCRQPEPKWLTVAATLPVAFAQVREDPEVDRMVLRQAQQGRRPLRVAMVGSGGCTAAMLAVLPRLAELHIIDPNPAQLALARLKCSLLALPPRRRLSLLGHRALAPQERLKALASIAGPDLAALGPRDLLAAQGPDHCGRYEHLFAALREKLSPVRREIRALLRMSSPRAQGKAVSSQTPLGRALDSAFADVLSLPNLVRLFGPEATRNPAESFCRHFALRTRAALASMPARRNTYLWQMLAGQFPPGCAHPWLGLAAQAATARLHFTPLPMDAALAQAEPGFDMVHLSNILDWLAPDAAARTLDLARAALRPGGYVVIRQLNSTLDIPVLCPGLTWLKRESAALLKQDRSFFYRALHIGRRA